MTKKNSREEHFNKGGWYGEFDKMNKAERGKKLFDKSLKNWNDKALGKKKSGTEPDEYNRSLERLKKEEILCQKDETAEFEFNQNVLVDEDGELFDFEGLEKELFTAEDLEEYKSILESIIRNSLVEDKPEKTESKKKKRSKKSNVLKGKEVTGGEIKDVESAGREGFRKDSGEGNNSKARPMTGGELANRSDAARRSNVLTKGKVAGGNNKKRLAQKMRKKMTKNEK